jgi:hypothetical protein
VTITGTNFYGATAVYFNGTNASFIVNSDTQITAIVPTNVTSGPISVVVINQTAVSTNNFTVDTGPVGYSSGNFALAGSPVVGNAPESVVALTNFDGHGLIALISANYNDGTLTVLTNNGRGGFGSNTTYTVAAHPFCLATADVNQDGKPDLICSFPDTSLLLVLTNNGHGMLGSNAVYSVSGTPFDFVATDVNGDGSPDLISTSPSVTVWTNNGNGSGKFSTSGSFNSNASYPRWLAVADFNGDGKPDVALACYNSSYYLTQAIEIIGNAGGGTFTLASNPGVSGGVFGIAAADVNGDGWPDLVYTSGGGNSLMVATNNRDGTFSSPIVYTVGSSPTCVITADVNGDGKPDVVCVDSGDNTLTVLTNNGTGRFIPSAIPATGLQPSFVVAVDVNNDGLLDLVVANTGTNTLSVLTNSPSFHLGITGFSPASGSPGTLVTISGTNLTTVTSVLFNGISAGFTINSDFQIVATVPSCMLSGPLTLINTSDSASSSTNFTFVKLPAVVAAPVESELDYALCNDSSVTFGFDGIINISGTKVISSDITLDGTGHNVTISGSNSVGIFMVNGGHVTLKNLTIANGYATSGGGLWNQGGTVTIINCTFSNNVAAGLNGTNAGGGAVCNTAFFGGMTVANSTFVNNRAIGGIGTTGAAGPNSSTAGSNGGGGGYGLGGGIYNGNASYLIITNCTFYNNQAIGGQGGQGGAGYNGYYGYYACDPHCCDNGPFGSCGGTCYYSCYENVYGTTGGSGGLGGFGYGGNIYNNSGHVTLVSTTCANGSVAGGTGGPVGANGSNWGYQGYLPVAGQSGIGSAGNLYNGSGIFLENTIVANPVSGGNYANYPGASFSDEGNNLCSDASMGLSSPTSLNNIGANLGPLTTNGGPTLTMALLPASPAIRSGTTNGAPATDQRGLPRKALAIDMGAYETQITPATSQPAVTGAKASAASFFRLSFTNTPGTSFSVWSATNLLLPFTNWTLLGFPHETTPGQFQFTDPGSTNNPLEFYRISSP